MTDDNSVGADRLKLQPLSHHFPVIFNNGTVVRSLLMSCPKCSAPYPRPDQVCGSVTKNSPTEYLIEGAGHCDSCSETSTFDFKIFDDRSIANKVDGEWLTVRPNATGEVPQQNAEQMRSGANQHAARRDSPYDQQMAKIGTIVMALRLGWFGAYIWCILPTLREIHDGSQESFIGTLLTNGALIAVGYVCSVLLVVNYFRKK